MKRPKLEDTRTPKGHQSIGGNSVNVYQYSKLQDEYIDYLEEQVKNCNIAHVVGRSEQLICKCCGVNPIIEKYIICSGCVDDFVN